MIVAHANHLVASGHDVCILSAVFDTVFTLDPRITCDYLPSLSKAATVLAALKTKVDADLIIADIIPMACFLLPRNRKKIIYFAQDYDESYYISAFPKGLIRFFYILGLRFIRLPTIAVSHPLANLLRKRFNANVSVVENGVDTSMFYPDPDKEMVVSKGTRKAVLLLSRSDPRKGFDIAIEVINFLPRRISENIEVWTVGEVASGRFLNVFRQRDFGYVGEEQLRKIMGSADIFFYPTRHEGFPLMVVEAFACQCPVVTTEAVPYAQQGLNALVSSVGNIADLIEMVEQLLVDTELAKTLCAEGTNFAAQHKLQKSLDDYASSLEHFSPDAPQGR